MNRNVIVTALNNYVKNNSTMSCDPWRIFPIIRSLTGAFLGLDYFVGWLGYFIIVIIRNIVLLGVNFFQVFSK